MQYRFVTLSVKYINMHRTSETYTVRTEILAHDLEKIEATQCKTFLK